MEVESLRYEKDLVDIDVSTERINRNMKDTVKYLPNGNELMMFREQNILFVVCEYSCRKRPQPQPLRKEQE